MYKIAVIGCMGLGSALAGCGSGAGGSLDEPGTHLGVEQSARSGTPLQNLANKKMCLGVAGGNNFADGT